MTYGCNVNLPDGRRSTRLIGRHGVFTPDQARDEAKRLLADIARGHDPAAAKTLARENTMEQFIDRHYADWAKAHLKGGAATVAMLKSGFSELLEKKLGEINSYSLEKWRSGRIENGAKLTTVNRYLDAIKAAMAKAVEWKCLDRNLLVGLKRCKVDDPSRVRYLSSDEERSLREALDEREARIRLERNNANQWRSDRDYEQLPYYADKGFVDHLKPMVLISLKTGLRRGELFRLRWDDVKLELEMPTLRPGPDNGGNLKESFPGWVMSNVNHVSERKRKTLHEKNYSQSTKESRNPRTSQRSRRVA